MLSDILVDWRTNYDYIIDGVIVSDDNIYERTNKNPDHSFAFKMVMSDQVVEAKVVDVIWSASKSGYLKPRVRIEPVTVGGVKIEYATGFNGNYIEENKIGVGAIIQIVRSGDVIPHIKSVTMPAEKTKMPDVPYVWTDTHVDIILVNKDEDETVLEKNITSFFTTLEIDGLSQGNIKRIMKAGYKSICKILSMNEADFLSVDGFKDKMAKKVYSSITNKIKEASLIKIMSASNKFGRGIGERKITPIMKTYPKILETEETNEEKIQMLMKINGIGKENAKSFIENIPTFLEFMKQCNLTYKYNTIQEEQGIDEEPISLNESHPLYGKKIVMTKVRDKEIIDKLSLFGSTLENNVNKNTFALIVKSKDDVSNKTKKANELDVPIFTPEEFIETYLR
jgi:NAD-dependent DNA ligase